MASELERAKEESVRNPSLAQVMDAMGARDRAKPRNAREAPHGEPTVHDAIVHHDVSKSEQRHPDSAAERNLAERSGLASTAVEDKGDRERSMKRTQGVVRLEPATPWAMVRAVHLPEPAVPYLPVEKRGPQVHRHRDDDRHRYPEHRAGDHASLRRQA